MRNAYLPAALIAGLFALLVSACSDGSPDTTEAPAPSAPATITPQPTPSPTPTEERSLSAETPTPPPSSPVPNSRQPDTLYGIAGLVPPNFPDSSDQDFLTLLREVEDLGGTIGNYAPLGDLAQNQEVGVAAGLRVLPVTGFHQDDDGGLHVTVDFADESARRAFLEEIRDFVDEYRPTYLGIGNEVNRVWEANPTAFEAWVAALPEIVNAVHEVDPDTQVFATFQYEFLVGHDAITGSGREANWTPLERAAAHLDLVAFTSYPYFGYETPEEVPADYYAAIAQHTDRPVGFTEIGWPSAPIEPLEGTSVSTLGGTPEEQAAFVGRLGALLEPVDPRFAMWVWAYDTPAVGPTFESLGLSSQQGEPKPALDAWRDLIAGKAGAG